MRCVTRRSVAVAACAGAIIGFSAAGETTTRVSVKTSGDLANATNPTNHAMSGNGRFVAFQSPSTDLAPGAELNTGVDVFVHDRTTGVTELVSLTDADGPAMGDCTRPSISADGRYVAFESLADNLVPSDTNGTQDIFVRDRLAATTTRVSVTSAGEQVFGFSSNAAISSDGRFVAFLSFASTLVPGDGNGTVDAFVHDALTGATTRESVSSAGVEGSDQTQRVAISGDGRIVGFVTSSPQMVPNDLNQQIDTFVRDRQAGTTSRVSVSSAGVEGNLSSGQNGLSLSADGRFVAFDSGANNLVPGSGGQQIYLRDTLTNQTSLVSQSSAGTPGNNGSFTCAISADGRDVAFSSASNNLVTGDSNGFTDIFVRDRPTNQTTRASVSTYVSTFGQQGFGGLASSPAISGDGRSVAFASNATGLVPNDPGISNDIFVHDRKTACPGDVNNDALVDFIDLNALLSNYGGARCY